ncbi:MAG: hemerythrin domain-containing protein [Sphingorhabdus sp.]
MPTPSKDAIALLKADHRAVEELFAKFESARGAPAQAKIVRQICNELIIHTMIEEEIFYPGVRTNVEADLLDEAYVEHDCAKVLITELLEAEPDEDFYKAKVSVLQEQIEHHVKEEEKRSEGLFAQAKQNGADVDALGEQLLARKQELLAMAKTDELPPPMLATMTPA